MLNLLLGLCDSAKPKIAKFSTSVLLLVLMSGSGLHAQNELSGQEMLTNASVIKMVQAHLSADVIVAQIENNPGNFTLGTNSLIRLKQAGVPDKVIAAMQAKRGTRSSTERSGASPGARGAKSSETDAAPAGTMEKWQAMQATDKMTGKVKNYAITKVGGDPAGRFQVEASCFPSGVTLFVTPLTKGLTLKKSEVDQKIETQETFNGDQEGTISGPRSCVFARVRVGEGRVQEMASSLCDQNTYAALSFYGKINTQALDDSAQTLTDTAKVIHPENDAGTQTLGLLTGFFAQWGKAMAQQMPEVLKAAGVPVADDVFKADSVRIEVPFTNGENSVIVLHPHDPSFQSATRACNASFVTTATTVRSETDSRKATVLPTAQQVEQEATLEASHQKPSDNFDINSSYFRDHGKFSGTLRQFGTALPELLQSATAAHGLPPRDYDHEVLNILDMARGCSALYSNPSWESDKVKHRDNVSLNRIPDYDPSRDIYDLCSWSRVDAASGRLSPRSLPIGPRGIWVQFIQSTNGFQIGVYFQPLASDPPLNSQNHKDRYGVSTAFEDRYGIVTAFIER